MLDGLTERDADDRAIQILFHQVPPGRVADPRLQLGFVNVLAVDDEDRFQAEALLELRLQVGMPALRLEDVHADVARVVGGAQQAGDLEPADAQVGGDLLVGQVTPVGLVADLQHHPLAVRSAGHDLPLYGAHMSKRA